MKVRYIQPAYNAQGFEEVIVSAKEAIRLQREYVAKVRPDFVYNFSCRLWCIRTVM